MSESNKRDIPFVQGKFNMGSSGVLNFCRKHWFKFIVSKRYDKSSDWGSNVDEEKPVDKDSGFGIFLSCRNNCQLPARPH